MTLLPPDMNAGICSARPRRHHPRFAAYGSVPTLRRFEDVMPDPIPRSEFSDRIKELDAAHAWPEDVIDFEQFDQDGTNFCWANAACQAANVAQRLQNDPYDQYSAASVACMITNFSNEGGWGIDAVKYLAEHGAVSAELWPNDAINRRYDTPEAEADRANHQPMEWVDIPCREQDPLITCLLQPWICLGGFDDWSHEVAIVRVVEIRPGVFRLRIRNSWYPWGETNIHGVDGFKTIDMWPSDAQAIRVVTAR